MNKTGPTAIVDFLGFEMEQQHKTLLIDLLVAAVVMAFIVLPSLCCQVTGPMLRPKDSWEDIIERHRKEQKEKDQAKLLQKGKKVL
jgi:hypothetical protein